MDNTTAIRLLRERIADLISKSPDKAAIILTEWLKTPVQKKAG